MSLVLHKLALLAGAAVVLAGPSLALASPADDAKVHVGEFSLSFNNDESDIAYCPAHTTATGGGFGTVNPPPLNVAINISGPVDETGLPGQTHSGDRARVWFASAYSGSGSQEDMKVFAICSASSDARLRVASFKVPPGRTRSNIVSCPRGQRALGGGLNIATSPVSGVYEEGSGPLSSEKSVSAVSTGDSPRAWEAAAYNGFSVTRKFQALVICSKTLKPHLAVSKVPVASNSDVEVAAKCPPGKRALGGGVLVYGMPTPQLQFVENGPLNAGGTTAGTVDGDVAVSWDGDVYNRTARSRHFKTLAVCA